MWCIYIIKCKNGALYTGATNDIQRRFKEHISGKGGRFTGAFKVSELLYTEPQDTKDAALKREKQIKGWTRRKKLALINGHLEALKKA